MPAMTYKEIQDCYEKKFNKTLKTCWIADVKRLLGQTTRIASNRIRKNAVKYPCTDKPTKKWLIKVLKTNKCP